MFFYTFLLIASLIVALVILWLYKAIVDAGKVAYKAILPSTKETPSDQPEEAILSTTTGEIPTPWGWERRSPWGWKSHSKPNQVARTYASKPTDQNLWGTNQGIHEPRSKYESQSGLYLDSEVKRDDANQQSAVTGQVYVDWPYRERKTELTGQAYKVTREKSPHKEKI